MKHAYPILIATFISTTCFRAHAQLPAEPTIVAGLLDSGGVIIPEEVAQLDIRRPDVVGLAGILARHDGDRAPVRSFQTSRGLAVHTEHKAVLIREDIQSVLVTDSRAYLSAYPSLADDAEMLATVRQLAPLLGADLAELVLDVRRLGRISAKKGETGPATPERIATKIVARRAINGVPVSGDFIVVSFANDGTVRKIVSHWRPFSSIRPLATRSPATVADLGVAAAVRAMRERELTVIPELQLSLSTFYRAATADPETLELAGAIRLPLRGPNGHVKPSEIAFDIP